MCVCECVCGRADASALINEPAIIIYTSCSSSYHPIYSHHSLISFVRSLFVVLDVWWSRLRSCSCSCGFAHSGFVTTLRVHSGFVTALQDSSSQHSSDHQSPSATILVLWTCTYLPHWRFNKEHLLAYCFRVSIMTVVVNPYGLLSSFAYRNVVSNVHVSQLFRFFFLHRRN